MIIPSVLPGVPARRSRAAHSTVERTEWVDVARGMAELSVVSFHILQAMTNARLTPDGLFDFWTPVGDMIRMPLMMLLAGLYVERSLAKGQGPYFSGKAKRVLWPFFVWAHVYALYWFMRPSGFDSRTFEQVLVTVVVPGSHLWFLQALFLYYVAAYFVVRRTESLLPAFGLAVAMIAAIPLMRDVIEPRLLYLFFFFLLGVQFSRTVQARGFPIIGWLGVPVVLLGVVMPILTDSILGPSKYTPAAVPASIAGVLASLVIARWLVSVPLVRQAFVLMGRYSLEIYCAHVIFSSATRQLFVGVLGISSFWPVFLAATAAGILLPIALAVALRRLGKDFVFEWPSAGDRLLETLWRWTPPLR